MACEAATQSTINHAPRAAAWAALAKLPDWSGTWSPAPDDRVFPLGRNEPKWLPQVNPHVIVWLVSGPTASAEPELWTIKLPTSPGGLVRMGWDKRSLNVGDRVIMEINPLRSGEHGGSFKRATLVDSGKVLTVNPPAALAKARAN
jgi:hypothetical protein